MNRFRPLTRFPFAQGTGTGRREMGRTDAITSGP